jgi:Rrf2 family nitric oxide-sensitive transcriptional repressor
MQLTSFSDYALRIALYLGTERDRVVSVDEISRAYAVSRAHLVKVVQRLVALGIVEGLRGRGGGLRLARPPELIGLGDLVRATEPHLDLVECFDRTTNSCPIAAACRLKKVLADARDQFLATLDGHTVADLLERPAALRELWSVNLRRPTVR